MPAERESRARFRRETRAVFVKLTVSIIHPPVGVIRGHWLVPVNGGLTLKLTDLRSWLLICRSPPTGSTSGSQLTGWA